jgi:lipopolysaccharide heptosyltransferase I
MSAGRRLPLLCYPARRIALIKPSSLGDIIHSLPVLTALRRRYPDAHITWVVNHPYEPLLRGHADLDATLPFDRSAIRGGVVAGSLRYWRFFRRLRQQEFDLAIDLQGLFRSGLMSLATHAPRRVGLSTAREGARCSYTDVIRVADPSALHAVDRYWLVAEALGAGMGLKEFRVPLMADERAWAAEILLECPRPWLMLAVGARWITKRWPPTHFALLVRRAQNEFGGTAIFIGGGDEKPLARAVMAQLSGPCRDLTEQTNLPRLAALLARADVMVGNDTGPLHLAAALGRPVVAPYTCTQVRRTGPYGAEAGAVESRIWCQGSYLKRCARLECMSELTPDRLWPILQGTLQQWQRQLSA